MLDNYTFHGGLIESGTCHQITFEAKSGAILTVDCEERTITVAPDVDLEGAAEEFIAWCRRALGGNDADS